MIIPSLKRTAFWHPENGWRFQVRNLQTSSLSIFMGRTVSFRECIPLYSLSLRALFLSTSGFWKGTHPKIPMEKTLQRDMFGSTRWFQTCFIFTPIWGDDQFSRAHFGRRGWFNHQLVHHAKLIWNPNLEVWKMIFLFKNRLF